MQHGRHGVLDRSVVFGVIIFDDIGGDVGHSIDGGFGPRYSDLLPRIRVFLDRDWVVVCEWGGCRCVLWLERGCGGRFLLILVGCDGVVISVLGVWIMDCPFCCRRRCGWGFVL